MASRDHEIHTEESCKHKLIELTLTDSDLVAIDPLCRLQEDDKHADIEDSLNGLARSVIDIHTAEDSLRAGREDPDGHRSETEQNCRDRS